MENTDYTLNRLLGKIQKKIETTYKSPDGEEFDDFNEFYDYMTKEYELTLRVNMIYDLYDIHKYMSYEELFAGEDYDDIDDFSDKVDREWTDYNDDLEERSGVIVRCEKDYDDRGVKYSIYGTVDGLLEFCEGQCDHYSLDNPGEALYEEIDALKNFKTKLANLK